MTTQKLTKDLDKQLTTLNKKSIAEIKSMKWESNAQVQRTLLQNL